MCAARAPGVPTPQSLRAVSMVASRPSLPRTAPCLVPAEVLANRKGLFCDDGRFDAFADARTNSPANVQWKSPGPTDDVRLGVVKYSARGALSVAAMQLNGMEISCIVSWGFLCRVL